MKRIILLLTGITIALGVSAQTDSTDQQSKSDKSDTIRIGNMVIIKKHDKHDRGSSNEVTVNKNRNYKPSNLTTNWWIVDLGINQLRDNTNYAQSIANDTCLPAPMKTGSISGMENRSTLISGLLCSAST